MTIERREWVTYASFGGVLVGAVAAFYLVAPRWLSSPSEQPPAAAATAAAPTDARKIRAHLYYVADDGEHLDSVEREVLYGEGATEQAKRVVEAVLEPPAAPLVSAIPTGTKLKALFVTAKGEAFVDFSPELRTNHPGGTTNEILTIYTIVNSLTTNLPAITSVQILVDGKEIDTLAGHLDLRRPLEQNLTYANRPESPGSTETHATPPPVPAAP